MPARLHRASSCARELGRWDLTAIGINQVIGGAVFALPAALAAQRRRAGARGWSRPSACASLLIALTFAEVGSRFDGTGGPYLYTRAAFGRFAAFEVGWMQWFTRAASWASVINVLVASLGFYWPAITRAVRAHGFMTVIIVALAAINIRGIRQSSWFSTRSTIGKLLPLAVFIVVGLFASIPRGWHRTATPSLQELSTSALLLIFAFGGYEVCPVRPAKRGIRGAPCRSR